MAGAAFGWIGEGGGEDVHVLAWAAELVVELVVDVQPLAGHAAGDGVIGVSYGDLKGVLWAVVAATAFGIVADDLAGVVEIDVGAAFFGTAAPAAEADHFVVLGPAREGVVGGVDAGEAAAGLHVIDEGVLGFLGPVGAVVVGDDDVVVLEGRLEAGVGALRCVGGDVHGEVFGLLGVVLHHLCRIGPVFVVVLAVDDEGFELGVSGGGCEGEEKGGDKDTGHGWTWGQGDRETRGGDDECADCNARIGDKIRASCGHYFYAFAALRETWVATDFTQGSEKQMRDGRLKFVVWCA